MFPTLFKETKLVNVCAINKKSHRQLVKFASSKKIQFVMSVSKNPNSTIAKLIKFFFDLMQIQLVDGGISNIISLHSPETLLCC